LKQQKLSPQRRKNFSSRSIEVAYVAYKFFLRFTLVAVSVVSHPKNKNRVETLDGLLHNPLAFTSPVDEVVAWGEDTWP
jgi:hypothetical protein